LTVKAYLIFKKQFTVFKNDFETVYRFPKLNSLSLHVCLIFDYRNPTMVSRWNPTGVGNLAKSGHCRRIPADQNPTGIERPESDYGQKLAGSGRIRLDLAIDPTVMTGVRRIWTDPAIDSAGFGQNGRYPA
jgi:hypothetical protein